MEVRMRLFHSSPMDVYGPERELHEFRIVETLH